MKNFAILLVFLFFASCFSKNAVIVVSNQKKDSVKPIDDWKPDDYETEKDTESDFVVCVPFANLEIWWKTLSTQWQEIFRRHLKMSDKPSKSELEKLISLDSLNCANENLTDLCPLQKFTRLRYLDCSNNDIKSLSPIQNSLENVTVFNFSKNRIRNLSTIKNKLKNVKIIDFSENDIENFAPIETELENCTIIRYSKKQLKNFAPIKVKLKNVKIIDYSEGSYTNTDTVNIDLKDTTIIIPKKQKKSPIMGNRINEINSLLWANYHYYEEFRRESAEFFDSTRYGVHRLGNEWRFAFHYNHYKNEIDEKNLFPDEKKRELKFFLINDLSYKHNSQNSEFLSELTNLEYLVIEGNFLQDFNKTNFPNAISQLKNLKFLAIYGEISNFSFLYNLQNLKVLIIQSSFTKSSLEYEIERLKQKLPNCKIRY